MSKWPVFQTLLPPAHRDISSLFVWGAAGSDGGVCAVSPDRQPTASGHGQQPPDSPRPGPSRVPALLRPPAGLPGVVFPLNSRERACSALQAPHVAPTVCGPGSRVLSLSLILEVLTGTYVIDHGVACPDCHDLGCRAGPWPKMDKFFEK